MGGFVGEVVAEELRDILVDNSLSNEQKVATFLGWQRDGIVDLSKLAGALVAATVGLDAQIASDTAGNAAQHNALFLVPLFIAAAQLAMTAYDVYQTVQELDAAIEAGDDAEVLKLGAILLGETASSLIPGGKFVTKLIRKLDDLGFGSYAKRVFRKLGTCSFDGSTLILTEGGYTPIKQIRIGDKVWSRNSETGVMGWQSVLAHYSNHYPETVKVAIRDLEQGMTQQIISNKIHPFFVQVPAGTAVPPSSEGHNYQGVLANGHWVDASNLKPGYRLLNNDGSWAEVAHVTIEDRPLQAYTMIIANDHTYFVRGAPTPSDQPVAAPLAANDNQAIWVHNDCFNSELTERINASVNIENGDAMVSLKKRQLKSLKTDDLDGLKAELKAQGVNNVTINSGQIVEKTGKLQKVLESMAASGRKWNGFDV